MKSAPERSRTGRVPLAALCCLVYFSSYVTRLDFAAVLVEIVQDLQVEKTLAGLAVTGSFVTYGIGMVICGIAADHIQPRRMIALGLVGTSLINLSVGVLTDIRGIVVIWCFNGLFQSMLWPPIVRLLSENLEGPAVPGAIAAVCTTSQVATVSVYLLAPVFIRLGGWRLVFLLAAGAGIGTVLFWWPCTARLNPGEIVQQEGQVPAASIGALVRTGGLAPIMLAIALMGMLRDGLQTWMPTYIYEVFGLNTASSIFTSALLPILSVVSIGVSMALLRRVGNEVLAGGLLFAVGFGAPAVGVTLFALLAGSMHGVNQMIACSLPPHFARCGRVAATSGLLNCFTYVGAAVSTYGFASFSMRCGCRATVLGWTGIACAGMLICLARARHWRRFCKAGVTTL